MQERGYKNGSFIPLISVILLSDILLLLTGCRNRIGESEKKPVNGNMPQVTAYDVIPANVKFRSFQNTDSMWGYTIFVNSRPYLHYSRIPFTKTGSGFPSKKDAEIVAGLLVKMIQNGNLEPKLNKRIIDSLELKMKMNKTDR
jgi:hypothetical protein